MTLIILAQPVLYLQNLTWDFDYSSTGQTGDKGWMDGWVDGKVLP